MIRGSRRGCVRLQNAMIGIDDEEDSTFTITVDQKVFHFQGEQTITFLIQCTSCCYKEGFVILMFLW